MRSQLSRPLASNITGTKPTGKLTDKQILESSKLAYFLPILRKMPMTEIDKYYGSNPIRDEFV